MASLFDGDEHIGAVLMRACPLVLLLAAVLVALAFGRALCAELHRFIVLFRRGTPLLLLTRPFSATDACRTLPCYPP